MRFRQRTNVLLPQPDGPITAVTWLAGTVMSMDFSDWFLPYHAFSPRTSIPTPIRALYAPFNLPRLVVIRTAATAPTIRTIRISDPAQACLCQSSYGEMA